jgi:predicted MFS family arabinose efflux permease
MVSLYFSLPKGSAGERPDVRKELAVLMRPQVVSALLTTVLGAGAMFTLYTYISPVLHRITDATPAFITAMLVLVGVGFSIGNYLGGKLADRSVTATLKGFLLLLIVIMAAIPWLARSEIGAAISMVIWGAATFAVVPPLQMRVMRVAHEAPDCHRLSILARLTWAMRWGQRQGRGDFGWSGVYRCAGYRGDYCRDGATAGAVFRQSQRRTHLHSSGIKKQEGFPS